MQPINDPSYSLHGYGQFHTKLFRCDVLDFSLKSQDSVVVADGEGMGVKINAGFMLPGGLNGFYDILRRPHHNPRLTHNLYPN